ncbi:hypothetical protein [Paracoccus sp. IB05]|uniref:hypothetical protein n=1 Tax=Paracoccus sp. IB05 TaxID=2779367 RepID=UPI0018E86CD6|nr:hypothetical protein [Paracoccus sp. IB05]MBJ2150315.1 hypothetical protein [Paracoccus sp. IB05]
MRPLLLAFLLPLTTPAHAEQTAVGAADFDWLANAADTWPRPKPGAPDPVLTILDMARANASWICTLAGSGQTSRCTKG